MHGSSTKEMKTADSEFSETIVFSGEIRIFEQKGWDKVVDVFRIFHIYRLDRPVTSGLTFKYTVFLHI